MHKTQFGRMPKCIFLLVFGMFIFGDVAGRCDEVLFDGSHAISGVKITVDPEDATNQVAFWADAVKGGRFPVSRAEKDFSKFKAISMRFYSAEADHHGLSIQCFSDEGADKGNYFHKELTIDWKGWKTIVIPFEDFATTRKPAGWNKITQILISNSGYGNMTPDENAKYYIDDVKMLLNVPPGRAAENGQPFAPVLSLNHSAATCEFPIDPSEEHIYGIQYELQGEPGAKATIRAYKTWDVTNEVKQKVDTDGHTWEPLISDAWETKRIEVLTKKGSAKLGLTFALVGKTSVKVRNVKVVQGGFPKNPPLPEAPYLDWIESLKPNAEFAKQSPLLLFKQGGGGIWDYNKRIINVSDEEQKTMQVEVAAYRALSAQALVELMPTHRPFLFHGGYWGWNHKFTWSPAEPDLIFSKGAPFDYQKQYPLDGYEEVVAPSGKTVKYAYHDPHADDKEHDGRRIYLDEFMTSVRINCLCRAGYIMAALYRKTGDPEYGLRSAAILWALARNMPDWPVVGKPVWNSPVSEERLREPDFYEWMSFVYSGPDGGEWYLPISGFMLWPARYYDMIRDSPLWDQLSQLMAVPDTRTETANGMLHIARMILKRDAYYRFTEFVTFHNLSGSANRTLLQLGRVLGVPDLVHHGLRKVMGAFRNSFMADGVFPEGQWYTLDQVGRQENALESLRDYTDPPGYVCALDGTRLDIGNPTDSVPTFQRVSKALARQTFPDGTALTVHDSWSQTANPPDKAKSARFPPRQDVSPFLFNAFGHAILGQGKAPHCMEAHLHYSGFYNHGHQDMLNLILWAYGDELVSDIGYTHISQYAVSSVSHNLVVVDSRVQEEGQEGNLLSWHAREGSSQVVQVGQGVTPAYPQCSIYRRALVLLPFGEDRNAVLDIFEVSGGNRHEWMANGCADYEQTLESNLRPKEQFDNLAADGKSIENPLPWGDGAKTQYTRDTPAKPSIFYGAFRNARITPIESPWQATMKAGLPADSKAAWAGDRAKSAVPKPSLCLHWVKPLDGEAILTEAPRNRYCNELDHIDEAKKVWAKNRMPKIIVRRDGKDLESTFIAVWEPFQGKPFLIDVQSLTDLSGSGYGVLLKDDAYSKLVLYRPLEARGILRTSGLATDGRFTIRTEHARETSVDLYEGGFVDCGKISANVNTPPSLSVTGVQREGDLHVITVRGSFDGYPASQPYDEYICFSQEGAPNRWLKLARIEKGEQESRLVLAEEPGFTLDTTNNTLHETYFPHRISHGQASILLSSWINLRWVEAEGSTTIFMRSSNALKLTLRDCAGGNISVQARRAFSKEPWRELKFTHADRNLILELAPATVLGEWLEVVVKGT